MTLFFSPNSCAKRMLTLIAAAVDFDSFPHNAFPSSLFRATVYKTIGDDAFSDDHCKLNEKAFSSIGVLRFVSTTSSKTNPICTLKAYPLFLSFFRFPPLRRSSP